MKLAFLAGTKKERIMRGQNHLGWLLVAIAPITGAVVLGGRMLAQSQPLHEGTGELAHGEELTPRASIGFEGVVLTPGGEPAVGAVVVSNMGGQAVTDAEGHYGLETSIPLGTESIRITAFGGSGRQSSASVSVGVPTALVPVQVGPLLLAQGAACPPSWLPTFGEQPGVGGQVLALASFDDGNGPALYVGGDFTTAGGLAASGMVRWDGTTWSALGSGISAGIRALAVFDDGTGSALYAAGGFTVAGGVATSNIARWDGSSWSALGSGVNAIVFALHVFDDGGGPCLYAGGSFTSAGGGGANRIAKWDGTSWSALGGGADSTVIDLTTFDDGGGAALYAGGLFTNTGGVPANRIAKWDGSSWSPLSSGMNATVSALHVFDDGGGPGLYAGGSFTSAGGLGAIRIAKWDGSSWSALGVGTNNTVDNLATFDDGGGAALYASGLFTSVGGIPANRIAKWDGSSWSALGSGLDSAVSALTVFDDGGGSRLFVGGHFLSAGTVAASRIVTWDGSAWGPLQSGVSGLNDTVLALAVFDDGGGPGLFAGGRLTTTGALAANRVAKWDGSGWSALGSGIEGGGNGFPVAALTAFDDGTGAALYVGGDFTTAGGVTANRIAKWDGTSWTSLGSGMNGLVFDLVVFDDGGGPALFAGGNFSTAGGVTAAWIARWDGTIWSTLGSGINSSATAFAVFDDGSGPALYVGGGFTTAGGASASRIAKWDGSSWTPLGSGLDGLVNALTVFDDGGGSALYAGGNFTVAGGASALRVAKWNGSSWSALGSGMNSFLRDLAVFDDGSGPALYAGGNFTVAGGLSASRIAKWSGASWSALGNGASGPVAALAAFDDGSGPALYAGGFFGIAIDSGDSYIARWASPPDTAPPTITCPEDIADECTSSAGAIVTFSAPAVDDCDPTPGVVCTPASGSTFVLGTTTVTCTATDAAGNSSMCQFDVTVEDTTVPVVSCPADITLECTSSAGAVANFTPTATDVCDPSPGIVSVPASGSTFPLGTTAVTVTATDAAGNSVQCTFSVTVEDTTAPAISCPAGIMVPCANPAGQAVSFATTVTDACDPSPGVVCVPASGSVFPVGTTTVTCTVTDAAGNSAQCLFDVTLAIDLIPPVITCPADILITCASPKGQSVGFSATATDACGSTSVVCVPAAGSLFPVGITTVTCTATDVWGNTSQCSFDVELVIDTTPPVITCSPDILVACSDPKGQTVGFSANATDACGSTTVMCVPPAGSFFLLGTTTVTCTATDVWGNTSQCTFDVTLTPDMTAPTINCPADMTVECGSSDGATVTYSVGASDDCDTSPNVVCSPPSGSLFPFGPTLVTCTATDASGNSAQCTFLVTVADTTPPTVNCPGGLVVVLGDPAIFSVSATDACDPSVSVSCVPPSGTVFPEGSNLVTCSSTDSSGNTGVCTFTVTVLTSAAVPTLGSMWLAILVVSALGLGALVLNRRG